MALRNLVAKMRSPAAAALRLPPRVSPPAVARQRFFFGPAKNEQHGKGINLESASKEELRRQADLAGKEIHEALERLEVKMEKMDMFRNNIVRSMKLWVGSFAAVELVLFADSHRRTTEK